MFYIFDNVYDKMINDIKYYIFSVKKKKNLIENMFSLLLF